MKKFEAGGFVASVVCALLLTFIVPAKGQDNISVPYYCSFEDSTENSHWVLNSGGDGANCNDKWYISSSTAYEGHNSLYISRDGGVNPFFGVRQPNVVVAYRPIILPVGMYDVSFDWKNLAEKNSGMYVCIIEGDDSVSNSSSGTIPLWVNNTAQQFNGTQRVLRGSQSWNNSSFILPVNAPNRRLKLAFVWINNNTDSLSNPLASCVDNIQIASAMSRKPYNFNVIASSCDSVQLSWDGVSSDYELDYRIRGANIWRKIKVQGKNYTFYNLHQEGAYDFRVRSVSPQDTSAWVSNYSAIVFCPENHCINYIDLDNNARCYTGMAGSNMFGVSKIDNGPDDMESRHTVYWTQEQYDPRTDDKLRTIPEGEFASVRLGNWKTGGEAERIEYEFTVDSVSNILLLKYAIVLEDPNHQEEQQPKFTLEILDGGGHLIDPDCGAANFYADKTRPGWYKSNNNRVTWKDWTTVGLNLAKYKGQKLTVRFTTQDCTLSGHYGYAYFTLNCREGKIKGVSCGEDPVMELAAPDGFRYDWSSPDIPGFHSNKQRILVDATDISTYKCVCSFTEQNGCSFELSTVVEPRFPQASFSYEITAKGCRNVVKFSNNSHVVIRKDGVVTEKDEPCENYIWRFNENEQSPETDPEYIFPKEGGVFPVTLIASIANGRCEDDTTINVKIEPIYEEFDTIYDTLCSGGKLIFCDEYLMASDEYVCVKPNRFGCDSTTVLRLTVLPPVEDVDIYDTICFGETYKFGKDVYNMSGVYERWYTTEHGCRGAEVIHLLVRDSISFSCSHKDVVDMPNSGSITIEDAPEGYEYSLNGVMNAPLEGLSGGDYTVVVYYEGCGSAEQDVFIDQNCLEVELGEILPVCADEGNVKIEVTVNGGIASDYSVHYGDKAVRAGFEDVTVELDSLFVELTLPNSCRPDVYEAEIVFHDVICDDTVIPVEFLVYYSSNVIRQKWNNVLAITNSGYNGGYDFSAFQWYRNGLPIVGEVDSYLYLGVRAALDTGDVYNAVLTRADDGVTMPTCTVSPEIRADNKEFPIELTNTIMGVRAKVGVRNAGGGSVIEVYDVNGRFYGGEKMGEEQCFTAPDTAGVYVVMVITDTERIPFKIIVVP